MSLSEAVITMTERRNWLTARIKAKESVGWCVLWDIRERDALTATLDYLASLHEGQDI